MLDAAARQRGIITDIVAAAAVEGEAPNPRPQTVYVV